MRKLFKWILSLGQGFAPSIYKGKELRITNIAVLKSMFDRAGLSYNDLKLLRPSGQFQVLIPKKAAPHFPENLAFVDRDRFWHFVQNSVSMPDYHQMTFTALAHSAEELYRINVLGLVPPPVNNYWNLVPKVEYA